MKTISALIQLQNLVAQLRDKEKGCPWILIQTFESLASLTIEESYELAHSVIENNLLAIKDELSDVLLHIVLYAELGKELGAFDLEQIAEAAIAKQLRRKPIFEEKTPKTVTEALKQWEQNKTKERQNKDDTKNFSILEHIPNTLTSLQRAYKIQAEAAKIGFDWTCAQPIFDKINEEMAELKVEMAQIENPKRTTEEYGDLLFAIVNLGRHLNIEPEFALLQANKKFSKRFKKLESHFKDQIENHKKINLEDMEAIWKKIKEEEKLAFNEGQ